MNEVLYQVYSSNMRVYATTKRTSKRAKENAGPNSDSEMIFGVKSAHCSWPCCQQCLRHFCRHQWSAWLLQKHLMMQPRYRPQLEGDAGFGPQSVGPTEKAAFAAMASSSVVANLTASASAPLLAVGGDLRNPRPALSCMHTSLMSTAWKQIQENQSEL